MTGLWAIYKTTHKHSQDIFIPARAFLRFEGGGKMPGKMLWIVPEIRLIIPGDLYENI
jgi:hypothetical protein